MVVFSNSKSRTQLCIFSTQYNCGNPLEKNHFVRGTRIFTAFLGCCARNSPIICAIDDCTELVCQTLIVALRIFIAGLAQLSAFLDFRNWGLKRLKEILNSAANLHLYSQYLGKKALDHEAAMTWIVLEEKIPTLTWDQTQHYKQTSTTWTDWYLFILYISHSICAA